MKRRHVLGFFTALVVVPPIVRIGFMRLQDNPLPGVEDPKLVFSEGWLLDENDLESELST